MSELPAAPAATDLEQAVRLDPGNAELLKALGNARRAAGELEGALHSYRQALAIAPDYSPALYNIGLVCRQLRRWPEAEAHFRRVVALDPDDAEALLHLGNVLCEQSQFAQAEPVYRAALRLQPGNPYLWLRLGAVCQELPGRLEESRSCLERSVALRADDAEAHCRLGWSLKQLGRIDQAIDAYRRSLQIEPDAAAAHNDLANILQDQGRLDEAVHHYREAARSSPGDAGPLVNLGAALVRLGCLKEAVDCLRLAARLRPESASAHFNLASALGMLQEREEAIRHYETTLRLRPGDAAATEGMLFEMQKVCDWSRYEQFCETRRRNVVAAVDAPSDPFSLLTVPSTRAEQLQCARRYAERTARAVAGERKTGVAAAARGARSTLRIGYLSADYREHPMGYLAEALFASHDRSAFETIAYSYGPDDRSTLRARLRATADRFIDIAAASHASAAQTIRAHDVDILVDLQGYTALARTEIVALRPAPVQVNYLGFPGTMGAEFIDYIVADRFVLPPEWCGDFSEQPVWLPASYLVDDCRRYAPPGIPKRSDLGLPQDAVVFCCFNQNYRILPAVFRAWMRLLGAVPNAVLWLLESNRWARRNLAREATALGVDPARLVFAPQVPLGRHLARLGAADLFLDTLPYNAHKTAADALWAGVPVVTCAGETFASRVATSLLHAAGAPELACATLEEYEALALRLATHPAELAALREKLLHLRATAPLFDAPAFTRGLETAYRRMWADYLAGTAPRPIAL